MPYFDGVVGPVYFKAWRVPPPRTAAVVLLHGFGEHAGLYHRLGNTLNASGIELWALDEIGHGLSDGERAVIRSVDDLVENGRRLTTLAAEADPQSPLVLAGHSLGGVAASVAVLRDPGAYRGLILSGTPLSPLEWVLGLHGDDGELALDIADLSSDPFYRDELENDPLAFTSAQGSRSLLAILPPAWAELGAAFADVELPILFVHGGDDPIAPVTETRAWAARLPHARITEFPGARHDVLNETVHREVAAAIVGFTLDLARPADDGSASGHPGSALLAQR